MPLVLKVTSINNQAPQSLMEYEFGENGGTIGRKSSNTWVLPDEQRHLSGNHASVEFNNGQFHLVDTSTNGVFVNGSDKPVGRGNKQQLEDGFQLLMGAFNIEVEITNKTLSQNDQSIDLSSEKVDDLFSDLEDDSEKTDDEKLFEPLNIADESSPINIGSDDPFFDFDDFNPTSDSQAKKKETVFEKNNSEMDSFFKPAKVSQFSPESTFEENDDKLNISNDKKSSSFDTDEAIVIPDDWALSDTNESSFDDLLTGFSNPLSKDDKNNEVVDDQEQSFEIEVLKEAHSTSQLSSEDVKVKSEVFAKGLGLSETDFKDGLSEQQFFLAGKLLRRAIEGTIEVLQSRAEIKKEMRMDKTTIQPIQNNPIKFAINTDEAIIQLLSHDKKLYMDPEQAMDEVYDDITSHQIAIISGIQASLKHVLKRFEPENLITRFEEDNPISANIPVHRKAKLWEAFERLYEAIETEAKDDFNRLFGQEFSKAYDQQVDLLKKKRVK